MLKEKLLEWQESPVTAEQRKAIQTRIEEAKEELLNNWDDDQSAFIKGMVRAFREILEWAPEVIEDEDVPAKESSEQSYH